MCALIASSGYSRRIHISQLRISGFHWLSSAPIVDDRFLARGGRDGAPRAVPDLDERSRETEELVAGGRQARAGLVADEHLAVELLLEPCGCAR